MTIEDTLYFTIPINISLLLAILKCWHIINWSWVLIFCPMSIGIIILIIFSIKAIKNKYKKGK